MTLIKKSHLRCDICPNTVAQNRKRAHDWGWRRDKIGRDICPRHRKLKGARP